MASEPVCFGGIGGGSWTVFGNNVMNEPCAAQGGQFQPAVTEFACWSDFGSSPGPSQGWNSLPWQVDTINNNPNVMGADGGSVPSHGCARPSFRTDPGFPVGTTGPLTWSFNFTQTSGQTRWAAYDKISGNQLPVTVVAAPACSNTSNEVGPNGQQIVGFATCAGAYELEFQLLPGVQAENVCFLAWNMGGSDPATREELITNHFEAVSSSGTCCNCWDSISQMATWLNQNDPLNHTWIVIGNDVCTQVAPGIAANYGPLDTCDGTSVPSVNGVGGGGTPPPPDECSVEWCITDANGTDYTCTHVLQPDGTYLTTYSPPGPPVAPVQARDC